MDDFLDETITGLQAPFNDAETLNDQAVNEYTQGNIAEAVHLLQRALDSDPGHLDALINLTRIFLEKKEHGGLEAMAESLLRHHGENPEALNEAGKIFQALGMKKRAVQAFRQAIRVKKETEMVREIPSGLETEEWKSTGSDFSGQVKVITPARDELIRILRQVCHYPHGDLRKGQLLLDKAVFENPDREANLFISPGVRIDLTGNVTIGPWCMIGAGTVILTHDHFHDGRDIPLLRLQERKGVKWRDKKIGRDVWLHGCTVLAQVAEIPDGTVVGTGSVLTANPGPYEIWAGNPARKVGERQHSRFDE